MRALAPYPSPAHLLAQRRRGGVAGALVGGVCSVGIEAEHANLLIRVDNIRLPPRLCGGGEVPCKRKGSVREAGVRVSEGGSHQPCTHTRARAQNRPLTVEDVARGAAAEVIVSYEVPFAPVAILALVQDLAKRKARGEEAARAWVRGPWRVRGAFARAPPPVPLRKRTPSPSTVSYGPLPEICRLMCPVLPVTFEQYPDSR